MPHVNTADEARAAVDAVEYAPEGHRGTFSGGRPASYGFRGAGRIAGCSCPDDLIPEFLRLGVQYFHSSVNRLLQHSSVACLQTVRQAAGAGK